jgi:hypothetical protein
MSQPAPYAQQPGQQPAPYAQSPTQPPASSATAAAPYSSADNASEPMPRRHAMRSAHRGRSAQHTGRMQHVRHGTRSSAPSDNIANQLNREELGRVSSGSSMGPAGNQPQGYAPQGYPQQNQPPSGAGRY